MFARVYAFAWILLIAAAGAVYFAGSFSETLLAVFGFLSSTLLFGFFVAVIPWWMEKHFSWKY